MRRLTWSDEASRDLGAYLDRLCEFDPMLASRARTDLRERAGSLRKLAYQGRPSRWHGWRELTVAHWKKIIVYDVREAEVHIIALMDSQQDLTAYVPNPE